MNLAETETYEAGIYQLEITDPVIGGPDGIDNLQAKQLANRTNWLKAKIDSILGMSFIHTAVAENPGDTDEFGYWDSFTQTLRKVTLANFIAVLKTHFDTVYKPIGALLFSDMPAGSVIQVENYTTTAFSSGSAQIPFDNTIPQISEGSEFMNLAFTPKKATSNLKIDITVSTTANVNAAFIYAIFKNTIANAIFSAFDYELAGSPSVRSFSFIVPAGDIATRTYSLRIGLSVAGAVYFNAYQGNPYLGGSMASSIIITEIAR